MTGPKETVSFVCLKVHDLIMCESKVIKLLFPQLVSEFLSPLGVLVCNM